MGDVPGQRLVEIIGILAQELNAATEPAQAAVAVLEAVAELAPWDSAYVASYSAKTNLMRGIYSADTMDSAPTPLNLVGELPPSIMSSKALHEGPQLILRPQDVPLPSDSIGFGTFRASASLMYAPMKKGPESIGFMTIQSYTPNRYTPRDLSMLAVFANLCGSALMRIWAARKRAALAR